LIGHLPTLVSTPSDPDAREAVMRASTLAGMAFGNADVGAVHCLSESIGGLTDLGHGLLNAVLIGPVLAYQMDAIREPLSSILPGVNAIKMLEMINSIVTEIGIQSFASLDIDPELFDDISIQAEQNGSNQSNRMTMSAADYRQILDSL
jgi:alcohol dehydrogenase